MRYSGESVKPVAAAGFRNASAAKAKAKSPAWGRELRERRARGERIELLQVVVGNWPKQCLLADEYGGATIVFLPDVDVVTADWSMVRGLDVVMDGDAPDDRFNIACLCALRAGAASVWYSACRGDGRSGWARIEFWPHGAPWLVEASLMEHGDPAVFIPARRGELILTQAGGYADAAFAPVRCELLADIGLNPDLTRRDGVSMRVLNQQWCELTGNRPYRDAAAMAAHEKKEAALSALYAAEMARMGVES